MAGINDALRSLTSLMIYQMQNQRAEDNRAFSAAQNAINRQFRENEAEKSREFRREQSDIAFKRQVVYGLLSKLEDLSRVRQSAEADISKLTGAVANSNNPDLKNIVGMLVDEKADNIKSLDKAMSLLTAQITQQEDAYKADIRNLSEYRHGFSVDGEEIYDVLRNKIPGNLLDNFIVSGDEQKYIVPLLKDKYGKNPSQARVIGVIDYIQKVQRSRFQDELSRQANARSNLSLLSKSGKDNEYKGYIDQYKQAYRLTKAIAQKDKDITPDLYLVDIGDSDVNVGQALDQTAINIANFITKYRDSNAENPTLTTLLDKYEDATSANATDYLYKQRVPLAQAIVNQFLVTKTGGRKANTSQLDYHPRNLFTQEDKTKSLYLETMLKAYNYLSKAQSKVLGSKLPIGKFDPAKAAKEAADKAKLSMMNSNNKPANTDSLINAEEQWLNKNKSKYNSKLDSLYNTDEFDLFTRPTIDFSNFK